MRWFGEPWPSADRPAPVCENPTQQVSTPVGEPCLHCGEEISSGDRGVSMPYIGMVDGKPLGMAAPVHVECWMRAVLGGPAHLMGCCTCTGGDCVDPDMGLSPRRAARAVWAWVQGRLE